MDNGLVVALCQALVQDGFVTFRFNFRGVGQSEGESTKGEKEHEDVGAALDFLRKWPDATRDRLGLVGYSFGASMVLTGLPRYKAAKALALISPPLTSLDSPGLRKDNRPMIFIGGDKDRLVPFSSLKDRLDSIRPEAELQMVPGADHSWRGHEGEAAQQATGFLQRYLKGDLKK
jgi:alpha/beta superfamily hydrolase